MIKAIVGVNWGDEGKGKITDTLASEADVVVRFQGGSNAGHTIKNEYGKFPLHMLPVRGLLRTHDLLTRSEERRVGKECRSRWSPYH